MAPWRAAGGIDQCFPKGLAGRTPSSPPGPELEASGHASSSSRGPGSRDRTAFLLPGGGSLGAVQVGMLYALLEAGVRPDLVVGSSVGAIDGAYLAGHANLESVEQLAALWESMMSSPSSSRPPSAALYRSPVCTHCQWTWASCR